MVSVLYSVTSRCFCVASFYVYNISNCLRQFIIPLVLLRRVQSAFFFNIPVNTMLVVGIGNLSFANSSIVLRNSKSIWRCDVLDRTRTGRKTFNIHG